ncbi:hypothetical protein Droror1_Dr00017922 [Drosera rotundifolia]
MKYTYLLLLPLLLCSYSSADPLGNYCDAGKRFSSVIAKANIDRLLAEIVQNTRQSYFSAISYGKGVNKVYGLAQCREDVSSADCSSCIRNATQVIRGLCPSLADARVWYDYCFLRYSNENFIGVLDDTSVVIFYKNVENVTNPLTFETKLGALFDKIDAEAVKSGSQGLGKGEIRLSPFETLYALVQCTRDLSQLSCAQCLATAIYNFQGFCSDSEGCRVLYSSCYVRYELYPFYFPLQSASSEPKTLAKIVRP